MRIDVAVNIFKAIGGAVSVAYASLISATGATAGTGINSTGGMLGQSFLTTKAFSFGQARMRFWSSGVTGNLTLSLYNTSGGVPTTKIADSTNTIDVSTLPTSDPGPTELNCLFQFPTTALADATTYAIVFTGSGITFGGVYLFTGRNSDNYAGGAYLYDSGGWAAHPSGWDFDFQIDEIV